MVVKGKRRAHFLHGIGKRPRFHQLQNPLCRQRLISHAVKAVFSDGIFQRQPGLRLPLDHLLHRHIAGNIPHFPRRFEQMQEQAVQQHMQIAPPQRRRFPAVAFQRFPNREIHGLPINEEARFGSKPPSQAAKGRIQIGKQITQFRPAVLQNPQTQFRLLFVLYHENRPLPQRSKLRS